MAHKWIYLISIILCVAAVTNLHAANILFLSGSLSAGNHIWNRVLASGLASRGHNVTFLTPEREVSPDSSRLHFIHAEGVYESIALKYNSARENHLHARVPVFRRIKEQYRVSNGISAEMSKSVGVQRLRDYPDGFQFDVIIHDTTAAQSLLGFWQRFNRPPLIAISPGKSPPVHLFSMADIPLHLGITLHPFADYSSSHLMLANRVYNILYFLYDKVYHDFPFMKVENAIAKRHFGEDLMDLQAIAAHTTLFLLNTQPVIDSNLLLPPNVVPIGALQLERPGGIPKHILMFLDASRNGVVVFSLGAGLFTPTLTREKDDVFMEVFQQLYQYDFLWKYEKTEKLECPRNVLMLDWLENQHFILQHPKVKLFITNGGPLSVQEAVYAGVPVLGIPMRFDQRQTLVKLQREGVAQLLPLRRLRNDTLTAAILNIVGEQQQSSFKENALRMSQLLRTQPDSAAPLQRAVGWIEYVLENRDLSHLESPVANVPFHVVYSLDMILAAAFTVIGFSIILFKHMVWNRMLAKAKKEQQQQQPPEVEAKSLNKELAAIEEAKEEKESCSDMSNANDGAEGDKKNS